MSKLSFQYAKGRFLDPAKIVDASIYSKQATTPNEAGEYPIVVRVALSLDTENKDKGTVYSDAFKTEQEAAVYIANVPSM